MRNADLKLRGIDLLVTRMVLSIRNERYKNIHRTASNDRFREPVKCCYDAEI